MKSLTKEQIEKERKRQRQKYYDFYQGKRKPNKEDHNRTNKAYNKRYPEKRKAKNCTKRLLKEFPDNHFHHWNYNPEHYRDVFELSIKVHFKLHRHLYYDSGVFMYRCSISLGKFKQGELLDSRERHLKFLELVKLIKD